MATVFNSNTIKYLQKRKLVGTYIEREPAERFALHSLLKAESRSCILEKIIMTYIDQLPSLETLLIIVVEKALKDWKEAQVNHLAQQGWQSIEQVTKRWEEYKTDLQIDLKKRSIPKEIIEEILIKIEENSL